MRLCEGRRVSDGWMMGGAAVLRWMMREMEAGAVAFMFEGMIRNHAGLLSLLYGLHVLLWRCASLSDGWDSGLYSKCLTAFAHRPQPRACAWKISLRKTRFWKARNGLAIVIFLPMIHGTHIVAFA